MRAFAIIVVAAAMYCSTHHASADEIIRLAQATTTPNVGSYYAGTFNAHHFNCHQLHDDV